MKIERVEPLYENEKRGHMTEGMGRGVGGTPSGCRHFIVVSLLDSSYPSDQSMHFMPVYGQSFVIGRIIL